MLQCIWHSLHLNGRYTVFNMLYNDTDRKPKPQSNSFWLVMKWQGWPSSHATKIPWVSPTRGGSSFLSPQQIPLWRLHWHCSVYLSVGEWWCNRIWITAWKYVCRITEWWENWSDRIRLHNACGQEPVWNRAAVWSIGKPSLARVHFYNRSPENGGGSLEASVSSPNTVSNITTNSNVSFPASDCSKNADSPSSLCILWVCTR